MSDGKGTPLPCGGCVYADPSVRWPGRHGVARACFFCIRNPDRERWQAFAVECSGSTVFDWADGSTPIAYPMDCFHTPDMAKQFSVELQWAYQKKADRKRGIC